MDDGDLTNPKILRIYINIAQADWVFADRGSSRLHGPAWNPGGSLI